jgi:hypothetical protein
MSTSNSDSSRGSLSAGVGKEGEDLGKLRKESSPDHDDDFLTYLQLASPIPNLAKSSVAMTVCPCDKGTLPQGPRSRKRATVLGKGHRGGGSCFLNLLHWKRQYHILFLHFALVHGGGRHDFWVVCSSLSKHFICFSKGPLLPGCMRNSLLHIGRHL